jgi:hypothetical protein
VTTLGRHFAIDEQAHGTPVNFETGNKLEETMDTTASTENTVQHLIDTLPEGWSHHSLKDENGTPRDTIFFNEKKEPVAWANSDENGVITEAECKEQ